MAIYRENHKEKGNFTQISNRIIEDTRVSDKSRFILLTMLSRPDFWKFNINGLLHYHHGGKSSLQSGLDELIKFGYLRREKIRVNGRIDYEYSVIENPDEFDEETVEKEKQESKPESETPAKKQPAENQCAENPFTVKQQQKKCSQKTTSLNNTNISHTETNNTVLPKQKQESVNTRTKVSSSKPKREFGSYRNVMLTDDEYHDLCDDWGEPETDRSIESMSKYIAVSGKRYNNVAVRLNQWIEEDIEKFGYIPSAKKLTADDYKNMFDCINKECKAHNWIPVTSQSQAVSA